MNRLAFRAREREKTTLAGVASRCGGCSWLVVFLGGHVVDDVVEPAVFHAQAEQGESAEVEALEGEGQDCQVRGERVGHLTLGGGVVVDVLPGGLRPGGGGADSFLGEQFVVAVDPCV